MRARLSGLALAVTLLHPGAVSASQAARLATAPARPAVSQSEEAWIVTEVVTAIARLTSCGPEPRDIRAVRALTAGGVAPPRFTVSGAAVPATIAVPDHIWAPEAYRGFAGGCLRGKHISGATDLDARGPLTDMTPDVIIDQSRRIAAALNDTAADPSAHDSAALVVSAYALREAQGWFTDHRPAISRIAAHLAIATASRGDAPATPDGQLARIVLTVLSGRQRDAMSLLDAFEMANTRPADRVWTRALRLRITGDWRKTAKDPGLSRLERLEHGRALRQRLGGDAFLDYLDETHGNEIDWQRIVFYDGLSVEAGNRFATGAVDGELAEVAGIVSRMRPFKAAPTTLELVGMLTPVHAQSTREGGTAEILDWPMWAAQLQRHLGHAMIAGAYSAMNKRGREAARELIAEWTPTFASLPSFAVVRRWVANDTGELDAALAAGRVLVARSPELLTFNQWKMFLEKPAFLTTPRAFPGSSGWFAAKVPTGTAFDLSTRAFVANSPDQPTRAQSARWVYERPYDSWAIWSDAWIAVDTQPSLATVRSALGPLLDYDVLALKNIADYLSMLPDDRIATAARMCELAADTCDRLAELQLLNNLPAQALETYERWATSCRDRVQVANNLTWLVRRHLALGNRERALMLAALGADTYASRGIEIMAEAFERVGRFDDAEDLYRAIIMLYPDNTVQLGAFLMRQAARQADVDVKQALELLQPIFPDGLQRMVPTSEPIPKAGVGFTTFGSRPASFGLQHTDMIVAVDGWRVRTARQYATAMRLSNDDAVTLTVWRANQYVEVRTSLPERWLGARVTDVETRPAFPRRP